MRFGSVSSGIEAASVAWHPLGWQAAWLAEIAPFPSSLLAHHYPDVPNLGDMTTLPERILFEEVEAPDVLCGGTPCQAFSVAGLRRSLDDARGNLALVFCEIADAIDTIRYERGEDPCIIFWENVPGVLTTKDNAFGCILAGLAGEDQPLEPPGGKWSNAGYVLGPKRAVAWRVLDAQYFGVAQRRRRVFVVASAREGFDPAEVLFEFDGMRRDSPPSREAWEGVTHATSPCLTSSGRGVARTGDTRGQDPVVAYAPDVARCIATREGSSRDFETTTTMLATECVTGQVSHTLKAEGFDASEDSTGRGTPIICCHGTQDPCHSEHTAFTLGRNNGQENAIAFQTRGSNIHVGAISGTIGTNCDQASGSAPCIAFSCKDHGGDAGPLSPTLRSMGHDGSHANGGGQVAVAVSIRGREGGATAELGGEVQNCLRASSSGGDKPHVLAHTQVRRLTPRECERLQGFPDDYTLIPHGKRVKPEKLDQDFLKYQLRGNPKHLTREDLDRLAADGPRYKALGNSWAVPNVRWIGARIDLATFKD